MKNGRTVYVTHSQVRALNRCRLDFWYWAERYPLVLDKAKREWVHPEFYAGQRFIGDMLLARKWMWLLKARRLGATTIVILYMVWSMTFKANWTCGILSQDVVTARKLLRWLKQVERSLPDWMRLQNVRTNSTELSLENGSECISGSTGSGAMRSDALDFLLGDEAAYIDSLGTTLAAAEPTLETSHGHAAVMSTSQGPGDDFHAGFVAALAGESKYETVFLNWMHRPDRDWDWYEQEDRTHTHLHGYMSREYPTTWEEAFESGGGRVFPQLSRQTHFVATDPPAGVKRYRAIDWGFSEEHPFICVWLWHDPRSGPTLTIEPDCDIIVDSGLTRGLSSGTDQMFAYRRDPKKGGAPIKMNDDMPDALRYAITNYELKGHVHIYRCLTVRNSDDRPTNPNECGEMVLELSGLEHHPVHLGEWIIPPDAETIEGTVCDRSGKGYMAGWRAAFGSLLPCQGHRRFGTWERGKFSQQSRDEVEPGIGWVNALIAGNQPFDQVSHTDAQGRRTADMDDRGMLQHATGRVVGKNTLEGIVDNVSPSGPRLYGYPNGD